VAVTILKSKEFEVPPLGGGLVTVTPTAPGKVAAAAGTVAVNWLELTNVVVGIVPPKLTIELATKFVPLILSVKVPPPAAALVGEIVVIVGTGFGGGAVFADIPPPHPRRTVRTMIPAAPLIILAIALLFMRFSSRPMLAK
jgi:hypothetical protein